MQFKELISVLGVSENEDFGITGIEIDSKKVRAGNVFVCIKGEKFDGHDFVQEAIANGAVAVISEKRLDTHTPCVVVKDSRLALAKLTNVYWGRPNKNFLLVGITGTNGKTTTTFIIKNILECFGKKVGVIGTLGAFVGDKKIESNSSLTTPDVVELNRLWAVMARENVDVVVMEVSAHAIAQQRIAGITFDIGVLTNVTQDHLDFFADMDMYKRTKQKFITTMCKKAVLNSDDEACEEIVEMEKNNILPLITSYGIDNVADNFATSIHLHSRGASYFLNIDDNLICINMMLSGKFNVSNALCAASVCFELGVDIAAIQNGINTMEPVPGRFNVIRLPNMASVVIDYAHTPDGVSNILKGVKSTFTGKVLCVFGGGGDRDKT